MAYGGDDPLLGLWNRMTSLFAGNANAYKPASSLMVPLPAGAKTSRLPFIGDPSGSGRNVAEDYVAGGRYSSQRAAAGDTRTVIPPDPSLRPLPASQVLTGAFSGVQPQSGVNTYGAETRGMPENLARIARGNLAAADRSINRFNYSAQAASRQASAPGQRLSAPSSFDRFAGFHTGGAYGSGGYTTAPNTSRESSLYGAYHSITSPPPPPRKQPQ